MTTPTGPIGLGHVQTEFGGSNPISLSEYYRGGAYVNSATAAGTSGVQIATSGAIRLGDFRAVTAAMPTNFGGTYWRTRFGGTCSTTVGFDTNGDIYGSGTGTVATDTVTGDNWYTPNTTSIGSGYWIRATLSSGSVPSSGTMNTWLQLSSARQWNNSSGGGAFGSRSSTVLFEISSSSGGSPVVCSGTVSITADHES